jgi:hypothetical protein
MEIPVVWLRSKEFKFHLTKLPVDCLNSFGLQNGRNYPNFSIVRKLLNTRFHYNLDDSPSNNPILDVKNGD